MACCFELWFIQAMVVPGATVMLEGTKPPSVRETVRAPAGTALGSLWVIPSWDAAWAEVASKTWPGWRVPSLKKLPDKNVAATMGRQRANMVVTRRLIFCRSLVGRTLYSTWLVSF